MNAFGSWMWTDKQPRKYGWYWYRWSESHKPDIILVFKDDDGTDSVRTGEGLDDVNFLDNYDGQWCGPIPMPNEPEN